MKFTVAIPAFKAKYLKESIDSVLGQTFTDYELIVVNDASPEDIEAIVNQYPKASINYHKNARNLGSVNVVDNWNLCLSYAKGDYFILMGDDDKMFPNYLQEFSALIDRYPQCCIYNCRTLIINEASNPVEYTEPRPEFESVYDCILERIRGHRKFFISDYVYQTAKLRSNGGFFKLPLAWASDDISAYIAARSAGIAYTNTPVFMYRRNAQSLSVSGNDFLKMDAILLEEKWLKEFIEQPAVSFSDNILRKNIQAELKAFIQKKKIRTIYASAGSFIQTFIKWFRVRGKYGLSLEELIYATILRLKEKRKLKYNNIR